MGEGLVDKLTREADIELDVTWLPFELHPDTPAEGADLTKYLGVPPESLRQMHGALKQRADELGLPLNPPGVIVNTHKALLLAEYARDNGKLDQLNAPLFKAYFVDGRNLADDAVLRELATEAGLDADASIAALSNPEYEERIRQSMAEARAYGVTGAPTFIVEDKYKIVGAQPFDRLRDIFRQIAQEQQ